MIRNARHITRKTMASLGVAAILLSLSTPAYADEFDDKINALKQQAAAQQNDAATYRNQASGYQARVNELQAHINALNAQIQASQYKYQQTTIQVEAAQVKLAKNKVILTDIVKTMYFDSGVTPLEMLASSSDISEFLDNEQYRESVKNEIQKTMSEIQILKKTLEKQQAELVQIMADQRAQKQQAAVHQAEANNLLAMARTNAAAADAQVRNSNSEMTKLKAQQAAALAARFGGSRVIPGGTCGGGYPGKWCNAAQDSLVDNWGMYNRECVSYTAFKVWSSGRNMPYWGGRGNAKEWPGNARAAGIPVDGNPRAGDVAIDMDGPYGHAMYVEGVSGGKVHVSQYNFGNRGEYSQMTIPASGLYFIHF